MTNDPIRPLLTGDKPLPRRSEEFLGRRAGETVHATRGKTIFLPVSGGDGRPWARVGLVELTAVAIHSVFEYTKDS